MKKIILIRHAESLEDIDPNMHNSDDEKIGITNKGRKQSIKLSKQLIPINNKCDKIQVFHSPSKRVRDTAYFVLSQLQNKIISISEVECIRNLNWGNTTPDNVDRISRERYKVGVLYYQFPNGDYTPAFVSKIGYFVRDILSSNNDCIIIFTHGFALRVIAKFLLNISDDEFRYLKNPHNCYYTVIEVDGDNRKNYPSLEKIDYNI